MPLHVVNKSTRVTDAQVAQMVTACDEQAQDFAGIYGRLPIVVDMLVDESHAEPGSWVIAVLDDSDQQGALGWHTEETGGIIFGRVFAAPVLDNGGGVLDGNGTPYSVSATLSHEVLETIADPHANLDADTDQGLAVAYEVCDPCEDQSYVITIADGTAVMVSNFVTPHWFDPQAPAGTLLDKLGRINAPYQITKGGYVVTTTEGKQSQVFGEHFHQDNAENEDHMAHHIVIAPGALATLGKDMPQWRIDAKESVGGRLDKRARHYGGSVTSEESTVSEPTVTEVPDPPVEVPEVPAEVVDDVPPVTDPNAPPSLPVSSNLPGQGLITDPANVPSAVEAEGDTAEQ